LCFAADALLVQLEWLNICMKIAEVITTVKPQAPMSPEQARVKAMQQSIARQKESLARERERQQNAKHAEKMSKLRAQSLG
jgi:hypothetical protein